MKYAQMEGAEIYVEEAAEITRGMRDEAKDGKAYIRMDLNVAVGRKPYTLPHTTQDPHHTLSHHFHYSTV